MSIKLSAPLIEDFYLEVSESAYGDGTEAPSKVTVRQATQGDHERRSRVFAEISRVIEEQRDFGMASMQIRQRWSMEELKRVEVFLTLAGCDILDHEGKPLFSFNNDGKLIDEAVFSRQWSMLPPEVANEIHQKVLKVNYVWAGPEGEGF